MALGVMRRHRRWLYVFLWIVILGFIAFYIPMFRQGVDAGGGGETLASVGDRKISVAEFQKVYRQQMAMYQRLYQGRMDPAMLRRMGVEQQVLEGLLSEHLIALEAERLGLKVDDQSLARALTTSPNFQENGRFMGGELIKRRLEAQGISPEEFEASFRAQLLRDQLEALITHGVGVTPAEVEREFRRRTEQAKVEYVEVSAAPFRAAATATDEEIAARFGNAPDRYKVSEQRVLAYLLVDEEALKARAVVTDADLETYFRENREQWREREQVCARHLLVKVKATPEAKDGHSDAEAKALAESLLLRIKGGADFAEVARKSSEDQGSAANGGDLGCFARDGSMVPEFEAAAFALEAGQTSDLVKSSFGYHVIRVTSRRAEQDPTLGAVKERIRPVVTAEKTQKLLGEQVALAQATLKRGTLEEAAKAIGGTVATSPAFSLASPPEPLASPDLAARAFAMKAGEIEREGFPVSRGYAFFRVSEVKPVRAAELAEVKDKVRAELQEEKALRGAREQAEALRTRAAKEGLDRAAAALKLVRKETPSLIGRGQAVGELGDGAAVEEAVFEKPEKELQAPVRSAQGYAVLRVIERKAFDAAAFAAQKAATEKALREQKRNQLFQAYMSEARERYPVERNPQALARVLGQG